MSRDPQHYLDLPYQQAWEWREDDAEPYWIVRRAGIPEVVGDGTARGEAEQVPGHFLVDYVRYRQAEGLTIAEPPPPAAAG